MGTERRGGRQSGHWNADIDYARQRLDEYWDQLNAGPAGDLRREADRIVAEQLSAELGRYDGVVIRDKLEYTDLYQVVPGLWMTAEDATRHGFILRRP
jgi:hypothetical protein